jgi:hypothetical protein
LKQDLNNTSPNKKGRGANSPGLNFLLNGGLFQMDIKTLIVGQKVSMVSGPYYGREGIVSKVTKRYVEVELLRSLGPAGAKNFIRFDTNGKACDSRDINDENMDLDGIPGTFEYGPWELTGINQSTTALPKFCKDGTTAIVDAAFLLAAIVCLVIGFWRT